MRVRKTAEYCSFKMNTLGFFWIHFVNKFQMMNKLIIGYVLKNNSKLKVNVIYNNNFKSFI